MSGNPLVALHIVLSVSGVDTRCYISPTSGQRWCGTVTTVWLVVTACSSRLRHAQCQLCYHVLWFISVTYIYHTEWHKTSNRWLLLAVDFTVVMMFCMAFRGRTLRGYIVCYDSSMGCSRGLSASISQKPMTKLLWLGSVDIASLTNVRCDLHYLLATSCVWTLREHFVRVHRLTFCEFITHHLPFRASHSVLLIHLALLATFPHGPFLFLCGLLRLLYLCAFHAHDVDKRSLSVN